MKPPLLLFLIFIFYCFSCSKNENFNGTKQPSLIEPPKPGKVTLLEPKNNALCEGTENNDDTFSVAFKWSLARHATEYTLIIYDKAGIELSKHEVKGTSKNINLDRNLEFQWKVFAENASGATVSGIFSARTPGPIIENSTPSINQVTLNHQAQTIQISFQDQDGDALFYDVISADNHEFNSPKIWADNQEIENAQGSTQEHSVVLEKINWTPVFWLKIKVRDNFGNQSVTILSRKF